MGSITVRAFKKAQVIAGSVASSLLAHIFRLIAGRMLDPEEVGELVALMVLYLIMTLPAGALAFCNCQIHVKI